MCEWISVDDELPKSFQDHVWMLMGDDVELGALFGGSEWIIASAHYHSLPGNVTHWHPCGKPKPPRHLVIEI